VIRRGLRESLEEYAARIGVPPEHARIPWRAEGLRLLNAQLNKQVAPDGFTSWINAGACVWEALACYVYTTALCRVAPGVAVPTSAVVGFE
jgi:hypothetical protein